MKFLQVSDVPEAPELLVSKGFITDVPPGFFFFTVKNNLCHLLLWLIDREHPPHMDTTNVPYVRANVLVTLTAESLDTPEEKASLKARVKSILTEFPINETTYFSDNFKEIKKFRADLINEIYAQKNR